MDRRPGFLAPLLVLALLAAPLRAFAAPSCSVTVMTGMSFGTYNVFGAAALTSTARIRLNCPKGQSPSVSLSTGNSRRFLWRELQTPAGDALRYNVYQDSGFSIVWGDGTDGSLPYVSMRGNDQLTLFGVILPGQDVPAGGYSDSLTVTVFL